MRPSWLGAGLLLLGLGVASAPSELAPARFAPAQGLPELGHKLRSFQARRWIQVEVPAGLTLELFLQRYHLTARTYVCRQECGGKDLKQAECAALSGVLWVAAGLPEPSEGPACVNTAR